MSFPKMPPNTYETLSGHALGLVEHQALVEWAVEALVAGFDTKSLRILAGLMPPHDPLEVRQLFDVALRELSIPPLSETEYVRYFAASVVRAMLDRRIGRKPAMQRLAVLHVDRGWDSQLRDFYLLYHALWDLETQGMQFYWPSADSTNIEAVVDSYGLGWLERLQMDHSS